MGAVNKPDELTVPAVADQMTDAFAVLLTVAMNCCVVPEVILATKGETEMLTGMGSAKV